MPDLSDLYASDDASRALRTLRRLENHDISQWALTGGTAIELHLSELGAPSSLRPLDDLDFIAESFADLPEGLGRLLLTRHAHPADPPGKTMLQAVDPESSVRLDVFRAYGSELARAQTTALSDIPLRIVAFEDLLARHARLCCDLLHGRALAPKFARDFLRMVGGAIPMPIECVWREHRNPDDPETFAETLDLLLEAISARTDLLIQPVYSTDVDAICPRCASTASFPLADARDVFAVLGYC